MLRLMNFIVTMYLIVFGLAVMTVFMQLGAACYEVWQHPEIGYQVLQAIQHQPVHKR